MRFTRWLRCQRIDQLFQPSKKGGIIAMLYQPHEEGQGLVEYALILVLVTIVVILLLAVFGGSVGNIYSNIVHQL